MELRFGKSSLRATSQLEFSSIAQKPEETIEQWADRVMDTAQKAFGSGTSPEIFQEQLIVRFALGCSDGTKVGEATPAVSVESNDPTVRRMSVGGENSHQHIARLLEQLDKSAPVEVESQAVELVKEFADIFAVNDLDLGNFSEIKQRIDTGDALPVKQRMRRTPAVFQGEEEGHLDKMLEAGVIQPSSSDWASAPVLVRKKDGNVRWCVDYRALN
ncbi:uncharacterized protein LOC130049612 [Ostrea edulis]|uniref:uncharacterized protein LOC130049612 n=1 Tax=Ostrea edulis TaxID=37623 RepID=UPI0024AF6CE6|nr:uncharacterized protein LOC130049612 [Ostrea edulis]